jgi:hypothetical protein
MAGKNNSVDHGAAKPWMVRTTALRVHYCAHANTKSAFARSACDPDRKETDLVREIKVDTETLNLIFYDNGVIDGDTISVYVNDFPVVSRRVLTAKPITIFVRIDFTKPRQEMVMVGENLGSIPPNTALMIVNAGDKRYQVYLASDNKKVLWCDLFMTSRISWLNFCAGY